MNKKIVRILVSPIIGICTLAIILLFSPLFITCGIIALSQRAIDNFLIFCECEPSIKFYNPTSICEFTKSPSVNYIFDMFMFIWIFPYSTYQFAKFGIIFKI